MSQTGAGTPTVRTRSRAEPVLTQAGLDRLLAALDADRDAAGEKYERLRRGVVRFFEWRGSRFPEDHADEAINRVARKLGEGENIRDIHTYVIGVARFVLKEVGRDQGETRAVRDGLQREPPAPPPMRDVRLDCIEKCLQSLPAESRELILAYYEDEKRGKIDRRKRLADELCVPVGTLRMRAHRVRLGLEECVKRCLQRVGE